MANTTTTGASAPASTNILGKHPEDIHGVVRQAAEALHWCSYLFHEMKKRMEDEDASKYSVANLGEIKTLLSLGCYMSFDMGDYIGREAEEMEAELKKHAKAFVI